MRKFAILIFLWFILCFFAGLWVTGSISDINFQFFFTKWDESGLASVYFGEIFEETVIWIYVNFKLTRCSSEVSLSNVILKTMFWSRIFFTLNSNFTLLLSFMMKPSSKLCNFNVLLKTILLSILIWQFCLLSVWDLSSVDDIECIGITYGIIGEIKLPGVYEPHLLIIR